MNKTSVNDKLKLLHDNGIQIIPNNEGQHRFYVVTIDKFNLIPQSVKGQLKGSKMFSSKEINKAIEDTRDYWYEKLIKKKEEQP